MNINNKRKIKKENYMIFNLTMFGLSIYVIFFPFFSKILEKIFPNLLKCTYKQITGNPCPLCGGTRYIANLKTFFTDITYLFNFFGFIILNVLLEIIFRIYVISKLKKNKKMNKIILFDIIWHLILVIIFISYEIIFIVNQS